MNYQGTRIMSILDNFASDWLQAQQDEKKLRDSLPKTKKRSK